jgi:hypothetical protein
VTNRAGYLAGGNSLRDAELASATVRPSSKERAITLLVDAPPASVDFGKR